MDTIKRFVDITNHLESISLDLFKDLNDFDVDSEAYLLINKNIDKLELVLDKLTGHICAIKSGE